MGHQGIGTDGPGMNLVVDKVGEFQQIDHAYGDFLSEGYPGPSVKQCGLTGLRETADLEHVLDLFFIGAVKNRRLDQNTPFQPADELPYLFLAGARDETVKLGS